MKKQIVTFFGLFLLSFSPDTQATISGNGPFGSTCDGWGSGGCSHPDPQIAQIATYINGPLYQQFQQQYPGRSDLYDQYVQQAFPGAYNSQGHYAQMARYQDTQQFNHIVNSGRYQVLYPNELNTRVHSGNLWGLNSRSSIR